ncbi:uncharacterized protein BDZ99DRAFT_576174 [Mytilinidion resinicola]|uniref:Uncharacterized protein n=1 Tax=Mytilinidion resinicola TaxID=574789 RepID=A0A6A6Y633_9PEZI|nr:uncharacterized protein BDZ99DRAFT_576174 [Mytilinidion resinicola]KAF2803257.1 hypothetical protein BDZ99DRAFT_576174 [Mytilinidion resinicola]
MADSAVSSLAHTHEMRSTKPQSTLLNTLALYRWFLRLTRVLQFLSAIISFGLFSSKIYKIYRLINRVKTYRGISGSDSAVESILAMIITLLLRGGGPKWLRWFWVLLDLAFVGAFIAVSVLTRPAGGPEGPSRCYTNRRSTTSPSAVATGKKTNGNDSKCSLPWGTFVLAIFST